MDDLASLDAAVERLNAGEQIAEIEPSLIEHMWEALRRIPGNVRQQPAGGAVMAKVDPDLFPRNPDQQLAMMVRYALFNALMERGILDGYMKDEALRKKVFTAAALLPCDQEDLREAVAERVLRQSPADAREKREAELIQAGYDRDHLKVADKFIEWMHDNC